MKKKINTLLPKRLFPLGKLDVELAEMCVCFSKAIASAHREPHLFKSLADVVHHAENTVLLN